jgi:hypothetical protein
MKLSDNAYTCLKWLGLIALPALAVCIKAIFPVWNLPYSDAIATTLNAIGALIGTLIGISTLNYNSQDVEDTTDSEAKG